MAADLTASKALKAAAPDGGKPAGFLGDLAQAYAGVFNSLSTRWQDFAKKKAAFHMFESIIIRIKITLVLVSLVMLIVNLGVLKGYNGIMYTQPGIFAAESAVFGLSTAVPLILMLLIRPHDWTWANIVARLSIITAFFFGLNYLLEGAGFWDFLFVKKEEAVDKAKAAASEAVASAEAAQKEQSPSERFWKTVKTTAIVFVAVIAILLALAVIFSCVKVFDLPEFTVTSSALGRIGLFLLETAVFAACSAAPVYLMAYNRGTLSSDTHWEFGLICIKFTILHWLLQFSGFWRNTFNASTMSKILSEASASVSSSDASSSEASTTDASATATSTPSSSDTMSMTPSSSDTSTPSTTSSGATTSTDDSATMTTMTTPTVSSSATTMTSATPTSADGSSSMA